MENIILFTNPQLFFILTLLTGGLFAGSTILINKLKITDPHASVGTILLFTIKYASAFFSLVLGIISLLTPLGIINLLTITSSVSLMKTLWFILNSCLLAFTVHIGLKLN